MKTTLQIEENRYVVRAEGLARVKLVRFPGAVQRAGKVWQLPQHTGVILALDMALGPDAWEPLGEAVFDADQARALEHEAPTHSATVELEQNRLRIKCEREDRELVKLVPGYRWSPAETRWYVAAQPLALDILRARFGELLQVSAEAEAYVEARRRDEAQAIERWQAREAELAAEAEREPEPPVDAAPLAAVGHETPPAAEDRVLAAIAELRADVLRLEQRLNAISLVAAEAAPDVSPREEMGAAAVDDATAGSVEELLELCKEAPEEALAQANRQLQTMEGGDERTLRLVAGIAAERAGQNEQAFQHLSRALESAEPIADGGLWRVASEAYVRVALALIAAECGTQEAIASTAGLLHLLFRELATDDGFDDERIGSSTSRDTLDLLVNDRALRRVAPELNDACRIAHLLSSTRSGTRLAGERVAMVLRERSLTQAASALAMILYANVCAEAKAMDDWMRRWPASEEDAPVKDGAWLVGLALEQLPEIEERALQAKAALAVLGIIGAGPAEQASLQQRRMLAKFVPEGRDRREAEFLAAFRLVAQGERVNIGQLPGYLERIAESRLENSAPHLIEVYMAQSGDTATVRAIADGPYLRALKTWGITDPETQVLELLDLLAEGPKADNAFNELGELIEDAAFMGAERFSRAQRKAVYERALQESIRMGHDGDTRTAFERLVRELRDEGANEELREVCARNQHNKHVRIAALVVQLELALEKEQPFEDVLEQLVNARLAQGLHNEDEVVPELKGLIELYPQLNEPLQKMLEGRGLQPTTEEKERPNIAGRRVLFIGGHRWLEQQAKPVLEDRWGVKVDWLDPREAKNGRQAIDAASGACDLVVINTRCISHAASGRVEEAAKQALKRVFRQNSHGVGGLLEATRVELEQIAAAEQASETKPRKARELRTRLR